MYLYIPYYRRIGHTYPPLQTCWSLSQCGLDLRDAASAFGPSATYQSEQVLRIFWCLASCPVPSKRKLCLTPQNLGCGLWHISAWLESCAWWSSRRYTQLSLGGQSHRRPCHHKQGMRADIQVYTSIYVFELGMSRYVPQLSYLERHSRICLTTE